MNENIETQVTEEVAATEVENPIQETQSTEVAVSDDTKSLAKDLGEMAIVGLVIYAFCKLVDWLVDKAKAGIAKIKEKRAAKKAQKQQAAATQQAPVANVQATQAEVKTEETAQQ